MITLYSKTGCSFCVKTKNLLEQKNVGYNEIVVGQDIVREEFVNLYPDVKTVPLIIVDGQRIGGYDQLKEWLDLNGPQLLTE